MIQSSPYQVGNTRNFKKINKKGSKQASMYRIINTIVNKFGPPRYIISEENTDKKYSDPNLSGPGRTPSKNYLMTPKGRIYFTNLRKQVGLREIWDIGKKEWIVC